MKTILWLAVIVLALLGCINKSKNDKVKITLKSHSQPNTEVIIGQNKYLDQIVLAQSKTDSLSECTFNIAIPKGWFVSLQIGRRSTELFIAPDFDLTITENKAGAEIPFAFSGKGAEINNYVTWVNTKFNNIRMADGGLIQLELKEFLNRFDSFKSSIETFHKNYLDSVKLTDEMISMLEYKNQIIFHLIQQEYIFIKLNNQLNEKLMALRNGENYSESTSKDLKAYIDDVPFETKFLGEETSYQYQFLLNLYWQIKINLPVNELIGNDRPLYLGSVLSDSLISGGVYPKGIAEFLKAFNLKYWLAAQGITTETDLIFSRFQDEYKRSSYLPALTKEYNEWLAIAPGKAAPDFEGKTIDGKTVSLQDLKGKIVYIDVWATWCAPCIAEIPASKKLQKKFEENGQIEFLNISIDQNQAAWEKFISEDQSWKGKHIILAPDKTNDFFKAYKLFGVPDYILIDQYGNIVKMKAPRPSEGKIEAEIRQLLTRAL